MRLRIRCPTALPFGNALAASSWSRIMRRRLRIVIGFVEDPARQQRRAHGLEIARQHDLRVRRLKFAEIVQGVFLAPAIGKERSAQRQSVGRGHALHTRNGGQRLLHLADYRVACSGVRVACRPWCGTSARRADRNPASMRCSARKLRNISPEPTSSTKQSATSATTTALRRSAPPLRPLVRPLAAQHLRHIGTRRAQRRHQAEQDRRQQAPPRC